MLGSFTTGVKSQVVHDRVGLEDLAPTVANLAGLDFTTVDGRDRSGAIQVGSRVGGATGAYAATSRFETLSYRWHEAPYDLIVDMKRATRVLCDVVTDPMCKTNLATMKRDKSNAMFARLHQHLGQPWTPAQDVHVTLQRAFCSTKAPNAINKRTPSRALFAIHPLDGFFTATPVDQGADTADRYRALGQSCLHPPESLIAYYSDFLRFRCGDAG